MIVWKLDQVLRVKGVKGRELARRMAIGENYLSRVRHEVPDRLSLTLIDGLCRELGCSVADLLEYQPEPGDAAPQPPVAAARPARAPRVVRPKPQPAAPLPPEVASLVEATLAAMDAPEAPPDTPSTTEAPPKGGATVATSSLQAKLNYLKRRRPL